MDNKTKVVAALMAVMVATGGFLLLPTVCADELSDPDDAGPRRPPLFRRRARVLRWFINNGTPETLSGRASTFKKFILLLEIGGKPVDVVIPRLWIVEDEILDTEELLDGEPFELGDTVTVETLMVEVVKDDFTVKAYLAYYIAVDGVTATALLPLNIETA